MLHRQQFLEAGKQRPQSEWDVGCVGCMNELQGSFFSPLFISGEFVMTLKKKMNK